MKIVCLSDTHNKHHYINPSHLDCDVLIHAGDFTSNGNQAQTISFLTWFNSLKAKHKLLVAGNHDFYATSTTFPDLLALYAPTVTYLRNSSVTIDGINFWGSPFSNTFGNWEFMRDDLELADIWDTIPTDTHVVITHGPAKLLGDKVLHPQPGLSPHVGSNSLRLKLDSLPNLKLHVTGHIHESYGTYIDNYVTVNASICDFSYVPFNLPIGVHI